MNDEIENTQDQAERKWNIMDVPAAFHGLVKTLRLMEEIGVPLPTELRYEAFTEPMGQRIRGEIEESWDEIAEKSFEKLEALWKLCNNDTFWDEDVPNHLSASEHDIRERILADANIRNEVLTDDAPTATNADAAVARLCELFDRKDLAAGSIAAADLREHSHVVGNHVRRQLSTIRPKDEVRQMLHEALEACMT